MKRIAFTFAGRQRMMRNQAVFVRRMLDLGLLDEWHVWNFARDTRDEDWLQRSFSEQLMVYTLGRSDQYVPLRAESAASCRIAVRASNDAHLRFRLDSGETVEAVLGAEGNTKSLLRLSAAPASPVPVTAESAATLVLFDRNEIDIGIAHGSLVLSLNGRPAFTAATSATALHALEVRTGAGASGQWVAGNPAARITLVNTGLKAQEGFRFAYAHYANARFNGCCFVKLDDDIVYCDLDRFDSFVRDLECDDELKISSANVVNNGVCAHYQARSGFFAAERFDFEYPQDGVGGTLWESSALCERLHRHFLGHREEILAVAASQPALTELPRVDRYSINFVGFRYPVMLMMTYLFALTKVRDDEHLMTVLLPAMFGVRKYVFNRLVVSHLSFYKQEKTLDSARLLEAYATLY
jgi:hypothetical protein